MHALAVWSTLWNSSRDASIALSASTRVLVRDTFWELDFYPTIRPNQGREGRYVFSSMRRIVLLLLWPCFLAGVSLLHVKVRRSGKTSLWAAAPAGEPRTSHRRPACRQPIADRRAENADQIARRTVPARRNPATRSSAEQVTRLKTAENLFAQ